MANEDYARQRLIGYSDRLSARHGGKLTFYVSAPEGKFSAEVCRLISIDAREGAGGIKNEVVSSNLEASYRGALQRSSIGGYAEFTDVAIAEPGQPVSIFFAFRPTLLPDRDETLIAFNGVRASTALRVVGKCLALVVDGEVKATLPLRLATNVWYRAALRAVGQTVVLSATRLTALGKADEVSEASVTLAGREFLPEEFAGSVTLAAEKVGPVTSNSFTGKIGDVALASDIISDDGATQLLNGASPNSILGTKIISSWSMGKNTASFTIPNDIEGRAPLKLFNLPMRAVTGAQWRGKYDHPELVPDQYNAVLFHSDMVEGGDWEPSLEIDINSEWRSGVYALKIYDGTDEDWIPFYVRPAPGKESKVLFLAPTNTYLAYGNETNSTADIGGDLQLMKTGEVEPQDADKYVTEHPELGLSIYDNHKDGAGVAYASRLRPMLNFRPFHFNWLNSAYRHFASDFYLLDWLEHFNFQYDVLTDEDLHLEGISSLSKYDVVITGSHPEYYSERMLDAVQEYVDDGGKLMYLGGNGFYWATSFHPEMPHVIEVRRGHTGARNWTSPPGETVHAFTGEQGGLWRNKGRGPHPLTGIGMGAVGWGKAGSYKPIENVPVEQQWILDGITDDLIGTEGMLLGGAAGDEIDHTDYLYGTPSETQVIASTVGLSEHFQPVIEYYTNVLPGQGGSQNPLVRADMTWLPKKNGGAIFSVGSICWTGCLPINDYNNSASRVTLNVLNNFVGNL